MQDFTNNVVIDKNQVMGMEQQMAPPEMDMFNKSQVMGTEEEVASREMAPQGQGQEQGQMQDPFNDPRYNDVQLPDAPINYGGNMAEQLLNDDEVPEDIKKKYWPIFHKDNILGFLDEPRKQKKMLAHDIMKIDHLNSMPYFDFTFEQELTFGILRNAFETKLDRSVGVKGGNVKNERIVLASTFSENRQITEDGNSGMIKEGFFKRLLGRR